MLHLFQAGASEITPPQSNRQQSVATDNDVSMEMDEPHPRFTVGPDDRSRASSGADVMLPCQQGKLLKFAILGTLY